MALISASQFTKILKSAILPPPAPFCRTLTPIGIVYVRCQIAGVFFSIDYAASRMPIALRPPLMAEGPQPLISPLVSMSQADAAYAEIILAADATQVAVAGCHNKTPFRRFSCQMPITMSCFIAFHYAIACRSHLHTHLYLMPAPGFFI